MAINLNAPNFGGLAALAGTRVGNIGLESIARAMASGQQYGLGVQKLRQQAARDAMSALQAQQKMGLARQQLASQESLAQQELGLKKENQASVGNYRQGMLNLGREQLEWQKQKEQLDALQKNRDAQSEEELRKRGALAATYISAQSGAVTDEEKQEVHEEILNLGKEKGLITNEQHEAMISQSPDTVLKSSLMDIEITQRALSKKATASSMGLSKDIQQKRQEQRMKKSGRQELSKTEQNRLQKEVNQMQELFGRMDKIGNDYAEEYLTVQGKAQQTYGSLTGWLGPIGDYLPGNEASEKFAEKRSAFAAQLNQMLAQYVKNMSGVQYGMKELEMHKQSLINSEDSPPTFKGKYKMMMDVMQRGLAVRQEILREGVPVDSPEFNERYKKEMQPHIESLEGIKQEASSEDLSGDFLGILK